MTTADRTLMSVPVGRVSQEELALMELMNTPVLVQMDLQVRL